MHAPEFPTELEWFNIPAPLTLASQRGKLVLLDFWTYCCINCMHILPDLRFLEKKYPDSLTVIGLHSPKFANERVGAHLSQAIRRYDIQHPVANDPAFSVWQQYGVHAWPTLVLIDTQGQIVKLFSGEGHRQHLDRLIQEQLKLAKQKGVYQPQPLNLTLDETARKGELAFPGKILATTDRLYISDSGHHRVIETNEQGKLLRSFGSGSSGLQDGPSNQALFNNPQGLTLVEKRLFVADTDNHALRCIQLDTGMVTTVAGTGEQGGYHGVHAALPLHTSLNSPWDIVYYQGCIFVAMAGCHQIWVLNLTENRIGVWAGSGREDIHDGAPEDATFAQPSGLTIGKNALYVADSESSAIRKVDFANAHTSTLIGMGLFEFGDKDGVGRATRLQHPLGVAYDPLLDALWIADTYDHKIRKMELGSQVVTTQLLSETLAEPGGLSYCDGLLWIADTNQHRIIKLDTRSGEVEQFLFNLSS